MTINDRNDIYVTISPNVEVNATINNTLGVEAVVTPGARGKSAYECWLEDGNTGSLTDFLNWLKSSSFIYSELQPLSTWTIVHNLGKYPSVTIVDSADRVVVGEVKYIDANTVEVSFAAAFSGQAFLN